MQTRSVVSLVGTTLYLALAGCEDEAGEAGRAGAQGTGGTAGNGGAAGTIGGAGEDAGGSAGTGGSADGGGTDGGGTDGGGASGSTGSDGNSGSDGDSGLHGGSSARFACASGATYGNPLEGMSSVTQIGPPTPPGSFEFLEGPVWIGSLGKLFFSDIVSTATIFELVPPSMTPAVFMNASGSNGLAVDNDDQLILADQRNRRIVRVDPKTAQVTKVLLPTGDFMPNDLIVRSDDNLYFTDPSRGFYWVSAAGVLSSAFRAVNQPNGTVLSTDESTLYVGDYSNKQIHRFPLAADGSVDVAGGGIFVTTTAGEVDGMAVDCAGNVYVGTADGVEVYSPAGTYIGKVPTGASSNATFGDADRKTLYVASRNVLKAVRLAVPGLPD
jgi:gluconolactonase